MNEPTTTTWLAACVLGALLGSASPARAQNDALQRAILIEEQEHDLAQAVALYREIAADDAVDAADRTRAWYRLGRALRRLGRDDAARDALERAAAGEGPAVAEARALLQDRGQDAERLRELRARARKILTEGTNARRMAEQLRWIGPAAVPELVREAERRWAENIEPNRSILRTGELLALIWELGGDPARAFLQRVLDSADTARVTEVASCVGQKFEPALLPIAERYLEAPGIPPWVVVGIAQIISSHRPLAKLLPLVQSDDPLVASKSWELLQQLCLYAPAGPAREELMTLFLPALRSAIESEESDVFRVARSFLFGVGPTTNTGRALLLELLPGWPRGVEGMNALTFRDRLPKQIAPPANLPEVVRAARQLGRFDANDQRAISLQGMVRYLSPHWTRTGLEQVVELIDTGYFLFYGRDRKGERLTFRAWLDARALEEDAPDVAQAMRGTPWPYELAEWLHDAGAELPESLWPVLRQRWSDQKIEDAGYLFWCMGRTGAVAAVPFLAEVGRQSPRLYRSAVTGLVELSRWRPGVEVRDEMRALMLHRFEGEPDAAVEGRGDLFHALMALGDVEFAMRYPELERAGLHLPLSAIASLAAADRARVWAHCLDTDDVYWSRAAEDFTGAGLDSGESGRLFVGPGGFSFRIYGRYTASRVVMPALPLFVDRARALLDEAGDEKTIPGSRRALLLKLLALPGKIDGWDDPAVTAQIEDLTTRCLQDARPVLRAWALGVLHDRAPTAEERPLVVGLLADAAPENRALALAVVSTWIPVGPAELAPVLGSRQRKWRDKAIPALLPRLAEPATAVVLPLLSDESATIRAAACVHLGRWADPASVPPLLGKLRDSSPSVRDAAETALRSIRFYHEQKRHWDRAASGVRVDAPSAAEALLVQAGPKSDATTRLRAIRSLGLLGVVETLPYLIDYAKDEDAQVREAAEQAIEAVQEKAAGGGR